MNPNYGRERFDTEAQKLNPIFEITNLAHNFRKNIEIAWSKNTVYPESDGGGRFDPAGQCLVTSRLFQDILKQELPDVITTLHLGKIKSNIEGAKAILINHSWLEVQITEEEVLIIDLTFDQYRQLVKVGNINLQLKSESKDKKLFYETDTVEDDKRLKETNAFKRFEILRKRYEKVSSEEQYYTDLFNSNIYLLGPVASGKSELSQQLASNLPIEAIDVGNIFRLIASKIIETSVANLNFEELDIQDPKVIDLILKEIQRNSSQVRDLVQERISFVKNNVSKRQEILFDSVNYDVQLRTRKVTDLVPIIAKIPSIRNLVWSIIKKYSTNKGGIILTGHSIKDIDTSKYSVINLTVDKDVATERVMSREADNYTSQDDATAKIDRRNESDGYRNTLKTLEKVFKKKTINTSELTPQQIKIRVLRQLAESVKKRKDDSEFQSEFQLRKVKKNIAFRIYEY